MKIHCLPALFCLALAGHVFGAKVIPSNSSANLVIGQPDFVTNINGFTFGYSSFNMAFPSAVAIDPLTGKVFVSDEDGDRVLRYASFTALKNGSGAEAVFGQASFNSEDTAVTQQGMNNPRGLFVDHRGRLWVADSGNHRVLLFEAASHRSTFAFADRVYGQLSFITGSANRGLPVSRGGMSNPAAVWVDFNDNLWVADHGNNRVLRFATITNKFSGSDADGVLGQALFTTSAAGAGSSGLQAPCGIAVSSGGELFVSCSSSHRILRFNNAATLGDGAGANVVFGQADFATTSSGLSATNLNTPGGLEISASDELWVSDRLNNRILRFNNASTRSSGAAADAVLGQTNFVTNIAANPATAKSLRFETSSELGGLLLDSAGSLWVADIRNHRILRFPPDVTKPLLTLTGTVPKKTTSKSLVIKGTASDANGISKIQYRIGSGALKTASGTTNWQFTAALKKGKNTITIFASDSVGNVSLNKVVKVKRS